MSEIRGQCLRIVRGTVAPKGRLAGMDARPCWPDRLSPAGINEGVARPREAVRGSADGCGHQREFGIARIRLAPASSYLVQAALALDLATWLEIASIKGGDRQS
jgi:hypothetical protein